MIYFTGDIHGEVFRVSDMVQRYDGFERQTSHIGRGADR